MFHCHLLGDELICGSHGGILRRAVPVLAAPAGVPADDEALQDPGGQRGRAQGDGDLPPGEWGSPG